MSESWNCSLNFVEVFDGPLWSGRLLGRVCSDTQRIFTSSANNMTVRFRNNIRFQNGSFSAWYNSYPRGESVTPKPATTTFPSPS